MAQSSDEEIGAAMAEKVEKEIGIYEMPVTSEYVEAIGSRLVRMKALKKPPHRRSPPKSPKPPKKLPLSADGK